jgi:hypothetical protein
MKIPNVMLVSMAFNHAPANRQTFEKEGPL